MQNTMQNVSVTLHTSNFGYVKFNLNQLRPDVSNGKIAVLTELFDKLYNWVCDTFLDLHRQEAEDHLKTFVDHQTKEPSERVQAFLKLHELAVSNPHCKYVGPKYKHAFQVFYDDSNNFYTVKINPFIQPTNLTEAETKIIQQAFQLQIEGDKIPDELKTKLAPLAKTGQSHPQKSPEMGEHKNGQRVADQIQFVADSDTRNRITSRQTSITGTSQFNTKVAHVNPDEYKSDQIARPDLESENRSVKNCPTSTASHHQAGTQSPATASTSAEDKTQIEDIKVETNASQNVVQISSSPKKNTYVALPSFEILKSALEADIGTIYTHCDQVLKNQNAEDEGYVRFICELILQSTKTNDIAPANLIKQACQYSLKNIKPNDIYSKTILRLACENTLRAANTKDQPQDLVELACNTLLEFPSEFGVEYHILCFQYILEHTKKFTQKANLTACEYVLRNKDSIQQRDTLTSACIYIISRFVMTKNTSVHDATIMACNYIINCRSYFSEAILTLALKFRQDHKSEFEKFE